MSRPAEELTDAPVTVCDQAIESGIPPNDLLAAVGTALSFCVFRIDRRYHGAVGRSLNKWCRRSCAKPPTPRINLQ
jgi:hypothetical protein